MRNLMKAVAMGVALIFFSCVIPSLRADGCSVFWNWASPSPCGVTLTGVAYGDGTYVAVGQAGMVLSSPDGVSWNQQQAGTFQDFTSVAYGDSTFVAIGGGGRLFTSANGQNWNLASSYGPSQVVYCGGFFFGDYYYGVYKSVDGKTWTPSFLAPQGSWGTVDITYGNGTYVCVLQDGRIFTSTDAETWTQRYSPLLSVEDIAFGNGTFLVLGSDTSGNGTLTPIVLTSSSGTTWTVTALPTDHYPQGGIVVGLGQFLVQSQGGALTSNDGRTWTFEMSNTMPKSLSQIIFAGGQYIGVGSPDSDLASSPDGVTWESLGVQGLSTQVRRVRYFEEPRMFVGVGARTDGVPGVVFSPDGKSWEEAYAGPSEYYFLNGIAYGDSTYVAVGDGGAIETSSDLSHWTAQSSGVTEDLHDVAYGAGMFVVVGQAGVILTSPDGETWTPRSSFVTATLNSLLYANGLFVAGGGGLTITTSHDGVTWTLRYGTGTGVDGQILDETYVSGKYLCVDTGILISSQDGVNWTQQNQAGWINGGIVLWHDTYIAPDYTGGISMSEDLQTWIQNGQGLINVYQLTSLATDGQTLVGASYQGLCWGQCVPFVNQVSNDYGPVAGGTSVDITGIGLGSTQQVLFGGVPSPSVAVQSDTEVIATTPSNLPGSQVIQVTTADGVCFPDGYFYYDGPAVVEGIAPVRVSTAGNSQSQIWGSGLTTGSITVGGSWVNAEGGGLFVTFLCPARPAGPADVVLTTPSPSGFVTTLRGALLYVDPPSVSSVTLLYNPTRLKIKGGNFHNNVDVLINGRSVPIAADKNSRVVLAKGGSALKAMIPKGTCLVSVLNRDDGVESLPFQFTR